MTNQLAQDVPELPGMLPELPGVKIYDFILFFWPENIKILKIRKKKHEQYEKNMNDTKNMKILKNMKIMKIVPDHEIAKSWER